MISALKVISLFLLSVLSIYFYYVFYPIHGESKDFFWIYIIIIALFYFVYQLIKLLLLERISYIKNYTILGFFLVQLLILSTCFFAFTGGNLRLGLVMFFKITFILLGVSYLWFTFFGLGKTILDQLKLFSNTPEEKNVSMILSIGVGFGVFMLGVFFLAAVGMYQGFAITLWILVCSSIGYKSFLDIPKYINHTLGEYSHDTSQKATLGEKINFSKVIDELHILVITFLLSVNFINIYRPFPIGWDDLGVYMNFPKLLSQSGGLLELGQMYMWQLYTGMGFLFGSQTFAFFLNSFAGVIVAIILYTGIQSFLKNKNTAFNIPLLGVMIILFLPMGVFQLAKDMKLDYGLLSISMIAIIATFHQIISNRENKNQKKIIIFALIGAMIGIAFSIKLTSLLLLLGVLASIVYARLSLLGFLAFLSIFLSLFTFGNLWSMMNVVTGIDGQQQVFISVVLFFLGLSCLIGQYFLEKKSLDSFKTMTIEVGGILLGVILMLSPWIVKNISEVPSGVNISVGNLLSGYANVYNPDFSLIYSSEEIDTIQKNISAGISSEGNTSNEDFGRYFGYEGGINNYLKLPWNLTFQVNQKGEFTDISYIFFVLFPGLFLFLKYKRKEYIYPIIAAFLLVLVYYIPNPDSTKITNMFSLVSLPFGYIFIISFYILPFIYLHFTLKKENYINKIFLINLAFGSLYVFLWAISAFGIVWYGIAMYFFFIFSISLVLSENNNEEIDTKLDPVLNENNGKMFIVLGLIWFYSIVSVIPHGITNLTTAGYHEYKIGQKTEEKSLFDAHGDYYSTLLHLNIDTEKQNEIFLEYKKKLLETVDDIENAEEIIPVIQSLTTIEQISSVIEQLMTMSFGIPIDTAISNLQQSLYEIILFPTSELKNTANIYRVGTFLKYFISENNTRIFEDSLITYFENYIYDEDLDITYERFKKLNIEYILLDLNAATIDQDPAQLLTKRYEHMLDFVKYPKMSLIETDSICLQLGLDLYKKNTNQEEYMILAGVNYGTNELKTNKILQCVDVIAQLIIEDKINLDSYPYLIAYKNFIDSNTEIDKTSKESIIGAIFPYMQTTFKALFKIQ